MSIKSKFKDIKDFASNFVATNLSISTVLTDEQNPAIENAFNSIYSPKVGKIETYDYVKYGSDDKLDKIYDAMLYKSATHSGIIAKKAKMVSGNKLIINGEESLGATEKVLWDAFKKRCGGIGKTFYAVIKEAAYLYEKDGSVGLDITYDNGFSSIISIKPVPQRELRCGLPDKKTNEITHFIKKNGGFQRTLSDVVNTKEEKIAAFDVLDESNTRQLLYIRNPLSSSPYYGMPNYLGAYYFIASDFEFGKQIFNSAKNGFIPKVLVTMLGRNMSQEEKDTHATNFKRHFQGSSSEQVILSWVRKQDEAPTFQALNVPNLDKTISVMANLDDAKILTAHNITSPTLFGIMVAGKLGGTGNELGTAYELFRATETLPNRELLLEAFNSIIQRVPSYMEKLEVDIEDLKINFDGTGSSEDEQKEEEVNTSKSLTSKKKTK